MEIKLIKSDIVLLADAHNPSIISPEWLKKNEIITEPPKNFLHSPDFSLFESDIFILIVDRVRLQLSLKKISKNKLESLSEIAKKYIKLLKEIPYKALGINFSWKIEVEKEKELPKIKIEINKIKDLSNIFKNYILSYGGIIHAKHKDYLLRINIVPEDEAMNFNFNFHHDLREKEITDIINFLNKIKDYYKECNEFLDKILR